MTYNDFNSPNYFVDFFFFFAEYFVFLLVPNIHFFSTQENPLDAHLGET
jgi:hypothetical protein